MTNFSPSKRTLGIALFVIGLLPAILLTILLTWAGFEAAFYGFQRLPGDNFDGLICPPLMTHHETAQIIVRANNPTNKLVAPVLRLDVSSAGAPETQQAQVKIEPGHSGQIEKTVDAGNIDLGFFIFAKAYRYPAYPLPNAEATCGIFIINLPFLTGIQFFYLCLALSLILVPVGLWRWSSALRPEGSGRRLNAAKMLAVLVLVGLLVSVRGNWGLGVLLLGLMLLAVTTLLRFVLMK